MTELLLATAGEDLRLWTMPNLNLHSVKKPTSTSVNHCTCSNNGQLVAFANEGQGINITYLQGDASILEIPTACEQSSVAFSNNSRFLVSGGKDCIVNIWDVKSRTIRRTFRDQINPVSFCVFNFNDKVLASSSDQGEIVLTEISSGLASDPLIGGDTEAINCLQYSHFTHNLLASASASGVVTLWDTTEKKLLRAFTEHKSSSTCLSFSPLNDMLLSSTGLDKRIMFYDVCYKKIVKTINTEEPATSCDFLHDGTTVAVGSASGEILLFDLRHGATPLTVTPAHRTSVRSASFQKLPKEKPSKRQAPQASQSQEAKVEKNNSVSSQKENTETPMEVTSNQVPSNVTRNNVKRNSQIIENLPEQKPENIPPQVDNNWRLSGGKSIENFQMAQSKYAKTGNEFFSPIELDSGRKPVKRSKSALKKYDIASKSPSETESPGMGARSKSGLSRLSLLSRSTGDLTRSEKKKEKENEEGGVVKRTKDITVDAKKGLFKSPFRKKQTDSHKRSDDSETSSVESMSIEDKVVLRGKKSHASNHSNHSNRSNDSDTKIVEPVKVTEPNKQSIDHNQRMEANASIAATAQKLAQNINSNVINNQGDVSIERFQADFIQNMIDEAMEETRIAVHNDMVNMQVEFIRQMEIQKQQIQNMLEHYSVNNDLVMEIQRLRTENEMLKKKY